MDLLISMGGRFLGVAVMRLMFRLRGSFCGLHIGGAVEAALRPKLAVSTSSVAEQGLNVCTWDAHGKIC